MHYAVSYSVDDLVELLLEYGASPNIRNAQGETALLHAAVSGHSSLVSLFLAHGASPDLPDYVGNVSFLSAVKNDDMDCISTFLAACDITSLRKQTINKVLILDVLMWQVVDMTCLISAGQTEVFNQLAE